MRASAAGAPERAAPFRRPEHRLGLGVVHGSRALLGKGAGQAAGESLVALRPGDGKRDLDKPPRGNDRLGQLLCEILRLHVEWTVDRHSGRVAEHLLDGVERRPVMCRDFEVVAHRAAFRKARSQAGTVSA